MAASDDCNEAERGDDGQRGNDGGGAGLEQRGSVGMTEAVSNSSSGATAARGGLLRRVERRERFRPTTMGGAP